MISGLPDNKYTGVDNLTAMQHARNYNAYLISTVLQSSGGATNWLDFGAGLGTYVDMLQGKSARIDCLEPDAALAETLLSKGYRNFADSKDVGDAAYDYVYSLNVFEHIEDDAAAISEVHRILAPGGRLFIYVPALPFLFGSMDRKVKHFRRYTKRSLHQLVTGAGFKIRDLRYADFLGVPVTLAFNMLSPNSGDITAGSVAIYDRLVFPASRVFDVMTSGVIGKNVYVVAEK